MMETRYNIALTKRHKFEMVVIIILATTLGLFGLIQKDKKVNERVSAVVPTVMPTDTVESSAMESPDGSKILTLKKQPTKNRQKYSFYTSSTGDGERLIFYKELEKGGDISIPYNAWSPDNKYVFLKETTSTFNNYYVFLSSGNPISDNAQYVNIQELFSQKLPDYKIVDVTGWADPALIIVNTQPNEGGQNISYWYDVTGQSFIRLGTYFD